MFVLISVAVGCSHCPSKFSEVVLAAHLCMCAVVQCTAVWRIARVAAGMQCCRAEGHAGDRVSPSVEIHLHWPHHSVWSQSELTSSLCAVLTVSKPSVVGKCHLGLPFVWPPQGEAFSTGRPSAKPVMSVSLSVYVAHYRTVPLMRSVHRVLMNHMRLN